MPPSLVPTVEAFDSRVQSVIEVGTRIGVGGTERLDAYDLIWRLLRTDEAVPR